MFYSFLNSSYTILHQLSSAACGLELEALIAIHLPSCHPGQGTPATWSNRRRLSLTYRETPEAEYGRLDWSIVISRSIHSFTQTLLEIGYCYRRHGPTNYYQWCATRGLETASYPVSSGAYSNSLHPCFSVYTHSHHH